MNKISTRLMLLFAGLGGAAAAQAQTNLNNGLLAYYRFNGNLNDSSGNGHHATGMGGIALVADPANAGGMAAFFDGVDDWINIPASPQITAGKRATIAFRFKTLDSVRRQLLVAKSDHAGYPDNHQYHFAFNTTAFGTNSLMFQSDHDNTCAGIQAAGAQRIFTYQPVQANTWYSIVGTFDSGVKKLYVNGALLSTTTLSGYANNSTIDSCGGGTLRLGYWWDQDPTYFNGYMDDVRLYNRALSQAEVDALNNPVTAGGGPSGGGNTGGATGVASVEAASFGLFPTPADNSVTVTALPAAFPLRYALTSPLGQVIGSGVLETSAQPVFLHAATAAGLYLLQLQAPDGTRATLRVVKK